MSRSLTRAELTELQHKFERRCKEKGLSLALTLTGKYASPQTAGLWADCQARALRGEMDEF